MNELQRASRHPERYQHAPDDPEVIEIAAGPRESAGLVDYWHMVLRNKGTIVLAAILGTLGGFLLTLASPRTYQARSTLEVQGLNSNFLNMGTVTPTMADAGYAVADLQTHVRILQSRTVVERAVRSLETQPPPADLQPPDRLGMWRRALNISPPTQERLYAQALATASESVSARTSGVNRIVEVTCESTSRQVAADFCNTLAQQYIDENLESRWKSTEYTGQWLTKQLQDLKVKLEQSEEELQSYLRETGLIITGTPESDGDRANAQEVRLNDLLKELSGAQADRIAKQSRYELATASSPSGLPEVLDDDSLRASQRTILELQTKLAQLSVTYTSNHAEVRRMRAQIAAIEASLESSRADILTRLRTEFEAARRREALLQGEYERQAQLVSGQAEQTAHYNLLKREVDASHMLYDTLLQRTKEASVASALRANNIRVVDGARLPESPYSPNVPRQITVGLLFGLVLGVAFAIVRERADRTLQDPGDISYYLGVPELGVIPIGAFPARAPSRTGTSVSTRLLGHTNGDARKSAELVAWADKSSLLAESFRTTLTSILFSRKNGERPCVLVFTSASPKEGKTTTVCNLGIVLAEINHRVLLVDGDMRRPRLHAVFDLENGFGLSDLLLQKTALDARSVEQAGLATHVPGLFVLPSGRSRGGASSLLHSARLPELLACARERFDTVVIDTPPMVNLADARMVARLADGLILVVRSGVTTRDEALLATSRFADDGTPILGTILNFWNPRTPGSSYYRYYYAGYHHYYGNGNGHRAGSDPLEATSESSGNGTHSGTKRVFDLTPDHDRPSGPHNS